MPTNRDSTHQHRWGAWLGTTPEQRWRAVGLFTFFFLVIAAFWLQKPIRTARFLTHVGPEYLPVVKFGTAMLVLPVVLLYSSLAARYRREWLVYFCTAAFAAGSLIFWWLFSRRGADDATWTSYAYFFYVDIFSSVMVALFWSFANDLNDPDDARRSYGFVGAGGILGGAAGSAVTGWSVQYVGSANLLLGCVGVLAAIAILARALARGHAPDAEDKEAKGAAAALREAVAGARMTIGSTYLTAIALLVIGYEIISNIIDYQFNTVAATRYTTDAAMAAFLGQFSTASNIASLAVQLLVTTWVLRRWGPRVGLLILPAALGLGSAAYLCVPAFSLIAGTFFADAALGYSLNQSTKEVLYTPTDEATKYQAKAFIDMFLMRFAKGLSSLLILGSMASWVAPNAVHRLSLISVVVAIGWIAVAVMAARAFARQATPSGEPMRSKGRSARRMNAATSVARARG